MTADVSDADGLGPQFRALKAAARTLGFDNVDSWVLVHSTSPRGVQTYRLYAEDPANGEMKLVFGLPTLIGLSSLEARERLTTMAEVLVAMEHARQEDDARYRAHGIIFDGEASGRVTLTCSEHEDWRVSTGPRTPLATMVATARGHHKETHQL